MVFWREIALAAENLKAEKGPGPGPGPYRTFKFDVCDDLGLSQGGGTFHFFLFERRRNWLSPPPVFMSRRYSISYCLQDRLE